MIFTLEALRAKHGDSLILHFGDPDAPRFVVIDGGPSGVYADAFRPRLDELAARWGDGDGQLPIDVMMLSHSDDDHARGLVELTQRLVEDDGVRELPFRVDTLWLNAFEDVLGSDGAAVVAASVGEAPVRIAALGGQASSWDGQAHAVVASVNQARQLRDDARRLSWRRNRGFDGLVSLPPSGPRTVTLGPLSLTVVGPLEAEVEALRADWAKHVRTLRSTSDPDEAARVAAYLDRSVYNLSSIVCLAELNGKRMLLTGDALGSKVLEGLERAGLMDAHGSIAVDVLKLPHHGSSRNVADDFFERIQARHYVVSGDGKYDNPEPATLEMISRTRPDDARRDDFTIHLTYDRFQGKIEGEIGRFLADERRARRRYRVVRRRDPARSLVVDLLDPVRY